MLPQPPFVLVPWIGKLDGIAAGAHLQNEIGDILEGNVGAVRPRPAAPADVISDLFPWKPLDRVVYDLDLAGEPGAVLLQCLGRHHPIVAHGGARVVELHQQTGIDDRLVLGVHRIGDRLLEIIVARIIFVLAIGNDARRRRHGQERFHHLDAVERILEVVDVLLQLGLTGISDRRHHYRVHDGFDLVARIELRVELRKTRPVDATGERIAARKRPPLETAEAKERVLRPADRFSELAVADDVDADLGLLAHDFGNGCLEASRIGSLVEGLAGLFRGEKLAQRRGTDEAADMGGEDPIRAAFHCRPAPSVDRDCRWWIAGYRPRAENDSAGPRPALHLLLQRLERLVDVVVTDENLHASFLCFRCGWCTGARRSATEARPRGLPMTWACSRISVKSLFGAHALPSSGASGTASLWRWRQASSRLATSPSPSARTLAASSAALIAPARPMASVPTGTPGGICTIEKSESIPESAFDSTGTPNTGSVVSAAVTPGRCAAPPAPAIMILNPCALADLVKAWCRSGVRCAEMIFASYPMPSASSVSAACFMVGQSDWLPMMIATGFPAIYPSTRPKGSGRL